jgi:tripartite ATP-independent transporter DctM subunit
MSAEFLSLAMFAVLILAITLGHPLAFTLAAVATLFGLIENGFNVHGLMYMFVNNTWGLMDNYTLVAIPLFIVMAQLLDRSKVAEALFDSLYIVLGSVRGGLGLAVVLVCTIFAATTGIIGASVVAMTLLATPILMEKGYQKEMTAGIICASGTLGILIPPSIMLVVYGGLTGLRETSVGNLFAAAVIPGLLLAALYFLYIVIRCGINPKLGPPISKEEARKWSAGQKWMMTLKSMMPPLLLILMVMGTILGGIATPTEAAGMGAAGALLLAFFNRKLNWTVLRDSCRSTLKTTAMVMALFIGGKLFSVVFIRLGGGDVVADLLIGTGLNRWVVLFIMMGVVFVMGMFVDWAAILMITVPIFLPIAMEVGFDPLWFSILMCVNLQTSFLTPPFGYALFYFKGVAPESYTMMNVYMGIIPFVLLQMTGILILMAFPSLVTFLPDYFFGR